MTDTPQEMVETLSMVLDGTMGLTLADMKWECVALDDLSELYVRNRSGQVFRLSCELVGPDEHDPFGDAA